MCSIQFFMIVKKEKILVGQDWRSDTSSDTTQEVKIVINNKVNRTEAAAYVQRCCL